MQEYKIIRYYRNNKSKNQKVIRTGLTLEQAQAWCSREDTHKKDEWFDGYVKM